MNVWVINKSFLHDNFPILKDVCSILMWCLSYLLKKKNLQKAIIFEKSLYFENRENYQCIIFEKLHLKTLSGSYLKRKEFSIIKRLKYNSDSKILHAGFFNMKHFDKKIKARKQMWPPLIIGSFDTN